jgi:hypothetical protein
MFLQSLFMSKVRAMKLDYLRRQMIERRPYRSAEYIQADVPTREYTSELSHMSQAYHLRPEDIA